jgi:hypothetical protein
MALLLEAILTEFQLYYATSSVPIYRYLRNFSRRDPLNNCPVLWFRMQDANDLWKTEHRMKVEKSNSKGVD